jgi:hypothetical protein
MATAALTGRVLKATGRFTQRTRRGGTEITEKNERDDRAEAE